MLERAFFMGRQPKVCIVGGGVAGLRTAELLFEAGAQVTVLEARERFGGRLAQSDHLGHTVDLGPNWIHGTAKNPILKLAHETNTILHSWGEAMTTFSSSGRPLGKSESTELHETYWSIIVDAFRYSREEQASIESGKSLMDYFQEQANLRFTDRPEALAKQSREMLLQNAEMWGAFVGSPTSRQSLKFFWLEQLIDDENPFVAGTYSKILARVAAPVVNKVDMRYKQEVKSVCIRDDQSIELGVVGKAPESFDEVVVTVPLGCLKSGDIIFHPPLPSRFQQAIDAVGYGCLDKVYITFPSAFWQQPLTSADPVGFFQWLAPIYDQANNPHRWGLDCLNLAALPPPAAHPTLLFYVFGECAQHIAKLAAMTPSIEADWALLRFFEPYLSRLPGYSSGEASCKPTGVLATAWANDKYAGNGSYSNFQVGLEQADQDIETIRHGLPDRHVWFAGEHMAPFVALGTVTGAYLSAEAVAQRVISSWNVDGKDVA